MGFYLGGFMRNFEILFDETKKLSRLDVIIAQLNIQLTLLKKSIKKKKFLKFFLTVVKS